MAIRELVEELERELQRVWDEYFEAQQQWAGLAGIHIKDLDPALVQEILNKIQDLYLEAYPAIDMIRSRSQFATNAAKGYDAWIASILEHQEKAKKESPQA